MSALILDDNGRFCGSTSEQSVSDNLVVFVLPSVHITQKT